MPAAEPRMTAVFASASASRAVPARTVAWTTSVAAGPAGPRVDQVVRSRRRPAAQRWTLVPEVARPNRPSRRPRSRSRASSSQDREVVAVGRGSATPKHQRMPGPSRIAMSPSASTTAAEWRPSRPRARSASHPLADAVEVEPESDRPADDRAARPDDRATTARDAGEAAVPGRRRVVAAGDARLGREPRVEQSDVDDAVGQALGLAAPVEDRGEGRPTGTSRARVGVEAARSESVVEPGQPGAQAPMPARGAGRRRRRADVRDGAGRAEVDADASAHHRHASRHELDRLDGAPRASPGRRSCRASRGSRITCPTGGS